jgi:hypothetical protein
MAEGDTVTAVVPALDGNPAASFVATCADGRLTVTVDGSAPGWRVLLVGADDVRDLDGAVAEAVPGGVMMTPLEGRRVITVHPTH